MSKKNTLLLGTFILTAAGLISRLIGFFYRIFLSQVIGAEEMGIFQLIAPVYGLMLSLCVGGIQTALSRFIAAKVEKKEEQAAKGFLLSGTLTAALLSLAAGALLYSFSDYVGCRLLLEPRTVPLLRIIALGLCPASIHSCLMAWYFGQNKTAVPSICQLLEQLVRVAVSGLVYLFLHSREIASTAAIAALGTVAGELFSFVFSIFLITIAFSPHRKAGNASHEGIRRNLSFAQKSFQPLMAMALPLTLNRIFINVLHSIETVLIPGQLLLSGLTQKQSLEIYGVLTGMALPMISFPSAITHAVSVMLLPDVAKDQASGNRASILRTTEQTIKYCMVLGIFAAGVFFWFGPEMGRLLFHDREAGNFLRILSFLSPFLYLETTLSSILSGLGRTFLVFSQNVAGDLIRICFVWLLVPKLGILGCLYGILASELAITLLNFWFLHREVPFELHTVQNILFPSGALLLALLTGNGVRQILSALFPRRELWVLIFSVGSCGAIYLLILYPFLTTRRRNGTVRGQ